MKLAASAVAFLTSVILVIAVGYAMGGISYWLAPVGTDRLTVRAPWSWLTWICWGFILLFMMPALSRRFASAFGAPWKADEVEKDSDEKWSLIALLLYPLSLIPFALVCLLGWWILRAVGCVGDK